VSEWISCSLADACSSIDYGLTASATSNAIGPKFLRITDIVSGFIDWERTPYVEASDVVARKYRLHDGDIVLARTGASTGTSAYIKDPPEAVFASYLVRLKVRENFDARFVSYYLNSQTFENYIRSVLGDKSAQPNASASTMTRAPLRAPKDIQEQRAISRVLGSLDDKIELNRRMNETLESIARAVFKSWFLDFDPVRAKAEGRETGLAPEIDALFPSEFDSTSGTKLPSGWTTRPLDEIAQFLNGLALQKFPPDGNDDLPVIKIAQLRAGNTEGADRANSRVGANYIVDDGDVLFSWSGSLECVLWTGGKGALNQHLFKVTSSIYPKWFYYLWIHEHLSEFQSIAAGKATTMGHIQRHHLSEAITVVPPEQIMKYADSLLSPILRAMVAHSVQSRTLAELRDTLLPKLISGELRVPDGETMLAEATV
jgi:type I restriction enzyme, S subunit